MKWRGREVRPLWQIAILLPLWLLARVGDALAAPFDYLVERF